MLHAGENHAGNPEEDNIIAGNQRIRRIEVLQLLCLFRPAERRERPQCRGEPRIQYILFLMDVRSAALRAHLDIFLGDRHFTAVITVICRNLMTPPQLTGDTPVMNVLHPAHIGLAEAIRNELDLAVLHDAHCVLSQRRHLDKPLCRGNRLYRRTAAVAGADIVGVVFNLDQTTLCFQIGNHCLAALIAIHALVLAAVFVDGSVIIEYQNLLQIMAQPHLKVVRVMTRRGLNTTRAELQINIIVRKDRNLASNNRQNRLLADQMLITLIVRVDRNAGIAHKGLRTGGCYDNGFVGILDVITDIPQLARLGFVLNLSIRQCRRAVRTPVDDARALVNQALVIQVNKDFLYRTGTALVHREALSAPVAGRAQFLELLNDAVAVLVLPRPYALQELLTAEIIAGQSLFLAQVFLYLNLRCNTGVVRARHPQCRVALHALSTDQNILQSLVKRMTHVQLSGNIWGRNNNGKRLFLLVYLRIEISVLFPLLIQSFLCETGIIRLWQFVCHRNSLPSCMVI